MSPNSLKVRLRAKRGDIKRCVALYGDRYDPKPPAIPVEMKLVATDERFDYFEGVLTLPVPRFKYVFKLDDGSEEALFCDGGLAKEIPFQCEFQYPYITQSDLMDIPEWVYDAVFYEIFPDRFFNGDPSNDPKSAKKWGELPTTTSFFGGDLKGIEEKLDYLQNLGVTAVYITPVFLSPTNHKYDTIDYYTVDPHFGGNEALRSLADAIHERGMRLVLDAVFNHVSPKFFAFEDLKKNGAKSKYAKWFRVKDFPVREGEDFNYETFAHVPLMPKLMTHEPEVREYLLGVVRHWTQELGVDGWRLDVANEVDKEFWRDFRRTVRSINPECFIIGEVWHPALDWLRGDQFDSVMNYPVWAAMRGFFADRIAGARAFDARLGNLRMRYPEYVAGALWNVVGTHDTERFLTACKDNRDAAQMGIAFICTYLGVPMLYYGDEVGMVGANDPDCRRTMIWDPQKQDRGMLEFVKALLKARRGYSCLRRGQIYTLYAGRCGESDRVYAYWRGDEETEAVVVFNNEPTEREIEVDPAMVPDELRTSIVPPAKRTLAEGAALDGSLAGARQEAKCPGGMAEGEDDEGDRGAWRCAVSNKLYPAEPRATAVCSGFTVTERGALRVALEPFEVKVLVRRR